MKTHYYIVITLVVLAAIVASVLLVPRQGEMALMLLKDKHFEEARDVYEKEVAQGEVSASIVNRLADLYLQSGDIGKAIEVMEKFVAQNPTNLDARYKLGTLYQYAERQDDYLRNLEEINRISPKPETLKQLSDIYNFKGDYAKQADAIKQLIALEKGKDPKQFLDLTNIEAMQHAYSDAISTLRGLQQAHPQQFTSREAELLVWLLFDNKQPAEAEKAATEWVQAHHGDTEEAARMVNSLHFRGNAEMGEKLIALYSDDEVNASASLLEEYVLLQLSLGRDDKAYARLKGVYDAGKLPPTLNSRLLLLAALRGERGTEHELLAKTDLTTLSEAQLLSLVQMSLSQNDPTLLAAVTKSFGSDNYQLTHPVLMAALSVGNRSDNAPAKLALLEHLSPPDEELLQMADICLRRDRVNCTEHMLEKLSPPDKLSDAAIANAGDLYLQMHEWDKGYAYISNANATRHSPLIDAVAVQFAAARGDENAVDAWLKAQQNINPRQLTDLYFIAINNHRLMIATNVAEYFHAKDDIPLSRSLLANAYVKTGQFAQAVKLLRQNHEMTEDDENNYLTALAKLAPAHPEYRKELGDYAAAQLRSGTSGRHKMALIYALVTAGQVDIAMPYIRELAIHSGGQWAALYAEQLDKEGKHEEARGFWLEVAKQPATTLKEKREIAYTLLEHGYKNDAVALFTEVATHAKPESNDVNELVYLWGPRPTLPQMQWLEARMSASTGDERTRWEHLIGEYGTSPFIEEFVARHPESLRNKDIALSYFNAEIADGTFAGSEADIIKRANESHDATALKQYAEVAKDNGFSHEERQAYEAIIALDPNDNNALREAGLLAFSQADYKASQLYLNEYIEAYNDGKITDADAYRAFFAYGELERHAHLDKEAKAYFSTARDLIEKQNLQSSEALSMKAQSQVWMGDVDTGLQGFDKAREMYPKDDVLRGDEISTLVDLRRYDQAKALLASRPQVDVATQAALDLPPAGGVVTDYTLLNKHSELVVQAKVPVDGNAVLSPQRFLAMPGLSSVDEGYDTLVLVAQPGYEFAIDKQTGMPQLVSAATGSQATLRYELLAARMDLETGHVYEAAKRLNALAPNYKNDPQLLGFTANAEEYGGDWPRAEHLLEAARSISPENEDIALLERDARREHAQNVTVDNEWIRRGDDHDIVTTVKGYANAGDSAQIGAVLQNDYAQDVKTRLADGRVGNFKGTRQQEELYALHFDENGEMEKLSLFSNNDKAGVGGYYHFLDPLGETGLTAEYHRPYWDLPEGVLDETTRDRVAVTQTIKPTQELSISATPGVNRYNTEVESDVTTTVSAGVDVSYRLIDQQPYLAVGYGLDAEYNMHEKKGFDDAGDYTLVFPMVSREIHLVSMTAGYEFTPEFYGETLVGYEYDRLGGNGPVVEGKLTYEITKDFDAQIRAMYGLDSTNTNNTLTRFGGYIRWRF